MLTVPRPKAKPRRGEEDLMLEQPFPIPIQTLLEPGSQQEWKYYSAQITDTGIVVSDVDSIERLMRMGCFGERTKSKDEIELLDCEPQISKEASEACKRNRTKLQNSGEKPSRPERTDEPIDSNLHLSDCEAMFLSFGLGCLVISNENNIVLSLDSLWSLLCSRDKTFPYKYAVYHHFRAKGWVVRDGLKFGVDFLLYKYGPAFYHASYSVLIRLDDDVTSWNEVARVNRVTESAAKELLMARIIPDDPLPFSVTTSPEIIKYFTVQEMLIKRWVPAQQRDKDSK